MLLSAPHVARATKANIPPSDHFPCCAAEMQNLHSPGYMASLPLEGKPQKSPLLHRSSCAQQGGLCSKNKMRVCWFGWLVGFFPKFELNT